MDIKNFNEIFQYEFDNDLDDNIDINIIIDQFIISKIINNEPLLHYLNECYLRSMLYDKQYSDIIINYIYLIYSNTLNILNNNTQILFYQWLLENSHEKIYFLHHFILKIIDKENKEGILKFNKYIFKSSSSKKYKLLEQLYDIWINESRTYLFSNKIYSTGIKEEQEGLLSWISTDSINHDFNEIYNFFLKINNDQPIKLLKILNNILNINIAYTYQNPIYITEKKCSSFVFIHIIFRIILTLYESNNIKIYPEYKVNPLEMVCKAFCINSNKVNNILNGNLTNEIIQNEEYQKQIKRFINIYINNNYHINDDFLVILLDYIKSEPFMEQNTYNYMLEIIKGNITKNPYIRNNTLLQLFLKLDNISQDIDQKNLCVSLFKYIIDINFDIYKYIDELINNLDIIFTEIINSIKNTEIKIEKIIRHKTIFKIISLLVYIYEKLKIHSDIIKKSLDNATSIFEIRKKYSHNTKIFLNIIDKILLTLFNLLQLYEIDINEYELEINLPLMSIMNEILTFFSNENEPIIKLYNSKISINIFSKIFMILNILKNNDTFTKNIVEHSLFLTLDQLIVKVTLDEDLHKNIIDYINKLKNINQTRTIPDDFLDPLLYIPIENAVMIPNVNLFFDKCSIISHLYHDETNPYTREKLTIDEFTNYNETDVVKQKVIQFNQKFSEWKNENAK